MDCDDDDEEWEDFCCILSAFSYVTFECFMVCVVVLLRSGNGKMLFVWSVVFGGEGMVKNILYVCVII